MAGTGLSIKPVAATAEARDFASPMHHVRTVGVDGKTPVSVHAITTSHAAKTARTHKLSVFHMDPSTGTQTEYHCPLLRASKIAPDILTANPESYIEGCTSNPFPLKPGPLNKPRTLEELPGYEIISTSNTPGKEYYLINRLNKTTEDRTLPRFTRDAILLKKVNVYFPGSSDTQSLWLLRSVKLKSSMRESDFLVIPYLPDTISLAPATLDPAAATSATTEKRTWGQWATAVWNSMNCMRAIAVEPTATTTSASAKTPRKLTDTSVSIEERAHP